MKRWIGVGSTLIVWLAFTPATGSDVPPDACGLSPSDWCSSPPGDRCGIHKDEAYAMCSFAGDLHVTQTVNNVKGVHAMLQKSILKK